MRAQLENRCKLFIENRDVFKEAFKFESSYMHPVCGALFTDKERRAEVEMLRETRKMLKARVGAFSNFRSACELPLVAMLALDGDPEQRLERAVELYGELKKHFFSSEYLPIAAMMLTEHVESLDFNRIAAKTKEIYNIMKAEHPFLTSSEDSIFAAMLALTDKSELEIVDETDLCYGILKEIFLSRNGVQSLSHVLTLADDGARSTADKCRDTVALYTKMKEQGLKYNTEQGLASLGVLAMLPCGVEAAVRDMAEVDGFLASQKGYGFFGLDKKTRLMHAAMIVTSEHMGDTDGMAGSAIGSTLSMIAAQQAAVCASITASVAAANAARAASN